MPTTSGGDALTCFVGSGWPPPGLRSEGNLQLNSELLGYSSTGSSQLCPCCGEHLPINRGSGALALTHRSTTLDKALNLRTPYRLPKCPGTCCRSSDAGRHGEGPKEAKVHGAQSQDRALNTHPPLPQGHRLARQVPPHQSWSAASQGWRGES